MDLFNYLTVSKHIYSCGSSCHSILVIYKKYFAEGNIILECTQSSFCTGSNSKGTNAFVFTLCVFIALRVKWYINFFRRESSKRFQLPIVWHLCTKEFFCDFFKLHFMIIFLIVIEKTKDHVSFLHALAWIVLCCKNKTLPM